MKAGLCRSRARISIVGFGTSLKPNIIIEIKMKPFGKKDLGYGCYRTAESNCSPVLCLEKKKEKKIQMLEQERKRETFDNMSRT